MSSYSLSCSIPSHGFYAMVQQFAATLDQFFRAGEIPSPNHAIAPIQASALVIASRRRQWQRAERLVW